MEKYNVIVIGGMSGSIVAENALHHELTVAFVNKLQLWRLADKLVILGRGCISIPRY